MPKTNPRQTYKTIGEIIAWIIKKEARTDSNPRFSLFLNGSFFGDINFTQNYDLTAFTKTIVLDVGNAANRALPS